MLHVAFEESNNAVMILNNLLFYLFCSNTVHGAHTGTIKSVFSGLLEQSWLYGLSTSLEYDWARWSVGEY